MVSQCPSNRSIPLTSFSQRFPARNAFSMHVMAALPACLICRAHLHHIKAGLLSGGRTGVRKAPPSAAAALLASVHCFQAGNKHTGAAELYFHKDQKGLVLGNEIDLAVPAAVTPLQNGIPAFQLPGYLLLAPAAPLCRSSARQAFQEGPAVMGLGPYRSSSS